MYRYELHTHTKEGDIFAQFDGAEVVELYGNAGYDGIVITNHYFSLFYEWFKDEIDLNNHKKIIDRYLKGYYCAKNHGDRIGVSVLCGAEVRIDNCINDYLIYGLDEHDFYELPLLNRMNSVRELVSVLPDYSVVVQAHPFRNKMVVSNPEPLFGIEGYNGHNEDFRNEMAKYYASYYNKVITSGSDFHNINDLAKGGIATKKKIHSSSDLISVLRCGEYALIQNNKLDI